MDLLINLGDWPLIKKDVDPIIPMFSWCGSHQTADIGILKIYKFSSTLERYIIFSLSLFLVLPTYDITEATLECMGRYKCNQGRQTDFWNFLSFFVFVVFLGYR